MNHLFKPLLTAFVFSILFISCDTEKEKIPAYLHIDLFSLSTEVLSEGLNTSEIVSAKVFVNGAEIGNFELPATIPVLFEGRATVNVFPNVKENASSNSQKYYRVYNGYDTILDLTAQKISTIKPHTTYRKGSNGAKFKWLEDFENQGNSLQKSGSNSSNDSMQIIPTSTPGVDQPFTGSNYCAYIHAATDSFVVFERSTIKYFSDLPFLGSDIYVEMDIKSDIEFQIGIYTDDGSVVRQVPVLVVNPTGGQWKKIYVNLLPETGGLTSGTSIRLFFAFYKETDTQTDINVYLDNLKLVHL